LWPPEYLAHLQNALSTHASAGPRGMQPGGLSEKISSDGSSSSKVYQV
jgi:hypothetical protein